MKKAAFLLDELGFDAAFNYKSSTAVLEALHTAAPDGVDMYFDNVGGIILEAALDHANNFARFIQCGMISQYNLSREETTGVRNLTHINLNAFAWKGLLLAIIGIDWRNSCRKWSMVVVRSNPLSDRYHRWT